jgi:hypothetical protein
MHFVTRPAFKNSEVHTYYRITSEVCLCQWSISIETVPGIGKGGMKESSGGGEIKYDIFDTL